MLGGFLYRLFFFPGSAIIASSMALASPFSMEAVRYGAKLWSRWFVWCARTFLGVRLVVRGRVPDTGVIVAFKHQSAYETILTLYLFHWPAVVMKAELRRIPVWGFVAARHGSIFVTRGKAGAALKGMMRDAKARVAEGRPILIFPEGTRVPVGQAPPIKAGLYGLYHVLGLPIVPVALDAGRVWPKGWSKGPGTVTLAICPEIPAGLSREDMEERVRLAINQDPETADVR